MRNTGFYSSVFGFDPQNYINQGQALFSKSNTLANGDFSGMLGAASGIVQDLPQGDVQSAVSKVLGAASAMAAGAAAGAVIGPEGAAVGAVIGALISAIENIGASPPPPSPIGDVFRGTADRVLFPSADPTQDPNTVYPGMINTIPRLDVYHLAWDSAVVQMIGSTPASEPKYSFGISWIRPPQGTPATKLAAYYLAQAYAATNAVGKALIDGTLLPQDFINAMRGMGATLKAQDLANRAAQAVQNALIAMGGADKLEKAMAFVYRWYGDQNSFPTKYYLGSNNRDWQLINTIQGMLEQSELNPGAFGWDRIFNTLNSSQAQMSAATVRMMAILDKAEWMLDWLYYPMVIGWGQGGTAYAPQPASDTIAQGAIAFNADTTLHQICEQSAMKVMGIAPVNDYSVLHTMLGNAWLWMQWTKSDSITNRSMPGANLQPHKNTMRVIGVIQSRIAADRKAKLHPHLLTKHHKSDTLRGTSGHTPRDSRSGWKWVLAALGAFGVVKILTRDNDK